MNLETIENELKSIRMLLAVFMAIAGMAWSGYMMRQATEFWTESQYAGLTFVFSGMVFAASSTVFRTGRFQMPRLEKLASITGGCIVWLGCAVFVMSTVVSLFSTFS